MVSTYTMLKKWGSAPPSPSSGWAAIYPKSDGKWYVKDDAGVETELGTTVNTTAGTGEYFANYSYVSETGIKIDAGSRVRNLQGNDDIVFSTDRSLDIGTMGINGILQSGTLGGTARTVTGADRQIGSLNISTEVVGTSAVHGLTTGDAVFYYSSGTAMTPITPYEIYFVRVLTTTTFSFYPTKADAIADTNKVNITANGSGTQMISTRIVEGSGTSFTSDFIAEDVIEVAGTGYNVDQVKNNNYIITKGTVGTASGATYKRGGLAPATFYILYVAKNGSTVGAFLSTRSVGAGDTLVDIPSGYESSYRETRVAILTSSTNTIRPFTFDPFTHKVTYLSMVSVMDAPTSFNAIFCTSSGFSTKAFPLKYCVPKNARVARVYMATRHEAIRLLNPLNTTETLVYLITTNPYGYEWNAHHEIEIPLSSNREVFFSASSGSQNHGALVTGFFSNLAK